MDTTFLQHEQFEGAKVLAEIGVKIASGRAELNNLERTKDEFLEGRAQEAIDRVKRVLESSKSLIEEIGKYQNELVGYRNEVDAYLDDILCLIQRVTAWKAAFDTEIAEKNKQIDQKIAQNNDILTEIKGQRALLAGETEAIKGKRAALRLDETKIRDEWATLGRAKAEITSKK